MVGGTTHMTGGYRLFHKDRQGRRRGVVTFYVKKNLEGIQVNYGDSGSPIECLWFKIREVSSRGKLSYWPADKGDKANEAVLVSLKQASDQQSLVLTDDFNYPDMLAEQYSSSHVIHQVSGMHRGQLPHTSVRCTNQEWHWRACYSQTKKTCFVIFWLAIALTAVVTILWSSCWAHWRLLLRQRF